MFNFFLKRKLDVFIVIICSLSVIMALVSIILSYFMEPQIFSRTEIFLYYIKISALAILSFSMIMVGLAKVRLKDNLRLSIPCLGGGLLVSLIYGVGGAYEYRVFDDFLEEKRQIIDKAIAVISGADIDPDEICEYSFSVARSIYHLRGEVTKYTDCNGETLEFSPSNIDLEQRNQIIFVEKSATRARNTMILFFTMLIIAVMTGLAFPKHLIKLSGFKGKKD